MKKLSLILAFCCLFNTGICYAWGNLAHELITSYAIENLPSGPLREILLGYQDHLQYYATIPDLYWKDAYPEEQPLHWFHFDEIPGLAQKKTFPTYQRFFKKYAKKRGARTSRKIFPKYNGTLPWRVEQLYQRLVLSFQDLEQTSSIKERKKQFSEILYNIGILAHYSSDLAQPLHLTVNYNGQFTKNRGIHYFYETALVAAAPEAFFALVEEEVQAIEPTIYNWFHLSKKIRGGLFKIIKETYQEGDNINQIDLDEVILYNSNYRSSKRSPFYRLKRRSPSKVFSLFEEQLAANLALGIVLQSCLIERAYLEAGSPSLINCATQTFHPPIYIPPNYLKKR